MSFEQLKKNRTLWERWLQVAEEHPDKEAIIHWVGGEEPFRWTFGELMKTADKFSRLLIDYGVKPGEVCAIIIKHNPLFYPLYLGISGAGALPTILAYPNPRLHPEKFRQGLAGMSQRSGLDRILTQHELVDIIEPFVKSPESTVHELMFPLDWDLNGVSTENDESVSGIRSSVQRKDPVLLQHSSGTTGLQKPVVISHQALLDHIAQYSEALQLDKKDKVVSWLPLYHDMGLIGAFHMPLACGITSIQIDPFEWVLAPILMFEAASKEKATMAWLPNFAFNLMADKLKEDELEGLNLSSFRMIINASEPIRHDSHSKFYDRFSRYGIKKEMLSTLYGMAEITLAFSQSVPGRLVTEITVDRQKLSNGEVVPADEKTAVKRVCVSSGFVLKDSELRIVDSNRNEIDRARVGEIAVKSISLFDGYRNYPEKTAEVLDENGWYYTGDYGFLFNNELFVIGRKKDIIIVAGKNIYPEDIEDSINQVEDVVPGRVIAFGEEHEELGTEQVSIVAETKLTDPAELKKLRLNIIRSGMGIDVNIHNVYLVPPRWLIKSSSGKPSRKSNRERILERNDSQIWQIKD